MEKMKNENKIFYGPVASRRFGFSLGIDIIPYKVCSFDCIYCQIGRTTEKIIERRKYEDINEILLQEKIKKVMSGGYKIDYLTFSGCGEPTLHQGLGLLIKKAKKISNIPILVLTNGSLLYREDVRNDLFEADAVKISVDAAKEDIFKKVNKPFIDLSLEKVLEGIRCFLGKFHKTIFIEIMLMSQVNDDDKHLQKLNLLIQEFKAIRPLDKIHINTPVRITADPSVKFPDSQVLEKAVRSYLPDAVIVEELKHNKIDVLNRRETDELRKELLSLLKRRPETLQNLSVTLNTAVNEVLKELNVLVKRKKIRYKNYNSLNYYYI